MARSKSSERPDLASTVNVHAIYNRHRTVDDAEESAVLIPPDSIVYVEGLQLEALPIQNLSILAERLGAYQRRFGKNTEYETAKSALIDELETDLSLIEEESDDAYGNKLYIELLKKDCQIVAADYKHTVGTLRQHEVDKVARKISRWIELEHDVGSGRRIPRGKAKYFALLESLVQRRRWAMDVREKSAVEVIKRDLTEVTHDSMPSESIVRDGKMQVYLTYGAMHRYSLTRKLVDEGIEVTPYDLIALDDGMYLDETYEQFVANRMRSLGFVAFTAATWRVAEHSEIGRVEANVLYDRMSELNEDPVLALDFASRCLAIQKKSDKKPKNAFAKYMKLIEDYS